MLPIAGPDRLRCRTKSVRRRRMGDACGATSTSKSHYPEERITVCGKGEGADFLRERARQYRERAARETDPDRAALLLELARALEREADAMDDGCAG